MRSALAILALSLLASCRVIDEQHTSLASEPVAASLGPIDGNIGRPKFFVGDFVDEKALRELVPYHSVELALRGSWGAETVSFEAFKRLVTNRPDAILIFPEPAKVIGVNNTVFFTPFTGMMSMSSAETATPVVGYAMRAARCRLPFRHDEETGFVRQIFDRDAAPELLEGDTINKLGEVAGQPPEAWPTWAFYQLWLSLRAGDSLAIEWIRPGKGIMTGTIKMLPPLRPHLSAVDSFDCKWLPKVLTTVHNDGRTTWEMTGFWGPSHTR
jgi:hypothetical protein